MISDKASEHYKELMNGKWNEENYFKECMTKYNSQFVKPAPAGTSQNSSTIELNHLNGVQNSRPKKVDVVKSEKYRRGKFYISQKMSFAHSETDASIAYIDDELYIRSLYNPKNSIESVCMHTAKLLSKKYSHNEYSYAEYFFRILSKSAKKYEYIKNSTKFTEFNIKTVNFKEAEDLNYKVFRYHKLYEKMHKAKVEYEVSRHKLNMLSSVQNFKKFKNLITEYEKCISDLSFKLATYENVDRKYNNALILSYQCLIIQAKENLKDAEVEMLQDQKYIKLKDKTEVLKCTYKTALQAVIDYRKVFREFLIYKKVAAYMYINPIDNKKVINGIKWNLKNPSGKLHSKTTLSSLQKSYNVVKFDKKNKKLIMNAGL